MAELNVEQMLTTGVTSGAIVAILYLAYRLCGRRQSRCRSGTCEVQVTEPGGAISPKDTKVEKSTEEEAKFVVALLQ